jgi:hypothetical protein
VSLLGAPLEGQPTICRVWAGLGYVRSRHVRVARSIFLHKYARGSLMRGNELEESVAPPSSPRAAERLSGEIEEFPPRAQAIARQGFAIASNLSEADIKEAM